MKKQKQTNKRIMKPNAAARPGGARPDAVPEGTARSASYVISVAVHALVLLVIFFSAQFIKSTPTPQPDPQFREVTLQFDVGVPGGTGTSVFDNQNPNPEETVDNPDQGKPEEVETPADPTAPKQQTARQEDPTPTRPKPDVKPHPNPAHEPVPATDTPQKTPPTTTPDNSKNPWTRDGGNDNNTTPGSNDGNNNPSHGSGSENTGPPPLPGTMTALPGWCRTKDDQNNSGATYSYKGGTYRCNCTLGQGVTCSLVK